ncbi:MAG TPA: lipopolysaccharide heptosyltransferase II [Candidatus Eisenbacteria bacterium]|nr:lipopolysaccharide heptosyltransferase II [Candidatus Eisenbacteria bacterium]
MTAALWPPPASGTRWIIRLPNWVGDAIMVLPALRALPRDEQFRVGIAHPRVLDLYAATGVFDQLVSATGASAPFALASRLRRLRPDRCLVFTEAPSGGWLALLSGAPLRLGRAGRWGRILLSHVMPRATRREAAWREHARLAEAAGAPFPDAPDFRVPTSESARELAMQWLPDEGAPIVVLAPGAAYGPAKRWPIASFAELTRRLVQDGFRVVALGSSAERSMGEFLSQAGAQDLTGRTNLMQSIAVLGRARLLVTNDSGALHLARAAGTSVLALFGSSSPVWTGPEPAEGRVLQHPVPCSPCFRRECPLTGEDHLRCLRGISVDEVAAAVTRGLAP